MQTQLAERKMRRADPVKISFSLYFPVIINFVTFQTL